MAKQKRTKPPPTTSKEALNKEIDWEYLEWADWMTDIKQQERKQSPEYQKAAELAKKFADRNNG